MKNVSLVLAGVLISSLAFAKNPDKPKTSGSSVSVTKSMGTSLIKLRYTSEKIQRHVRVTLLDERGNSIYSETINKTGGFIRPYNFKGLPDGRYAVEVEDENGRALEKIDFNAKEAKIAKHVRISEVPGTTNKYVVMISTLQKDDVTINIYDNQNNLVHSEQAEVNGGFGKVYTLNGIKGASIEISDSNGLLKSAQF